MDAHFQYCAEIVRHADHDRYLAALFAPADRRPSLLALYAFDAEISRIRDLAHEPMPGEIRLQWWREAVLGERASEASANPVAAAFDDVARRFGLSREGAAALVEAHRFDVYNEPMENVHALADYATKTAGCVMSFAADILEGSLSKDLVDNGAQAQTIASVLALLPRHCSRHQLFVPADILRRHGAHADDFFAMRATPQIRSALADLRSHGQECLRRTARLGTGVSGRAGPALLPLAPLRRWFKSLEKADYDPFNPPIITRWLRQWDIWRASRSLLRIGS